ncbi:MAG: Ger(x)C family spore germination protein [Oscillospiraceae bacterium]|jgi:spore germination protein KC|nr:Ger(x)C family spore germination protein [Oscillospiraceae bacterium]
MSKIVKALIITLTLLFFGSGCGLSESKGVDQTVVVQEIGIDFDLDKGEYDVTIHILDLSSSGGQESPASGSPITRILKSSGKSIQEALYNTIKITGEKPLHSQIRLIIFGEDVMLRGIDTATDFFMRDYEARSTVPIAIAKGFKASEILEADEGNSQQPARTMQKILQSGNIDSLTDGTMIVDLVRQTEEKTSSIYMPVLTLEFIDDSAYAKFDGMGIFEGDKLKFYLTAEEARAMLWVTDHITTGSIVVEDESLGVITLNVIHSKTKTKTQITNSGDLKYTFSVKTIFDINEINFSKEKKLKQKEIDKISKVAEKYIEDAMKNVLDKTLKENKCDPFRLGRRLLLKYPEEYRNVSDNWDELLPLVKTQVDASVQIRRTGKFAIIKD